MGDRWLVLGTTATIGAALVAAVAQAGPTEERFPLDANAPRVTATGSLTRGLLTVGGDRTIACGSIPSVRPAASPARQRHWGIWSFARHFID